jgi:predicted XRE-type DNA-binding protein
MNVIKRAKLEAQGWKFGTARDFLGLSAEEAAYVEIKLQLANAFRDLRKKQRLTQVRTAKLLRSSQSRVAKMEAGDPSVSMDLLVRALLALGITHKGLVHAIRAAGGR